MAVRPAAEERQRGLCGLDLETELAAAGRVVDWMKRNNVESFSIEHAGVSIKLSRPHDSYVDHDGLANVAPVPSAFENIDGAGVCSCGHSWVEHDVSGCLHGCSHEVCVSDATKEPEDD